jgi:hypothetical protein
MATFANQTSNISALESKLNQLLKVSKELSVDDNVSIGTKKSAVDDMKVCCLVISTSYNSSTL